MRAPSKKSSIIAAVIWIAAFIFAFTIPSASHFIWVPDTLLLFGFYPLLISIKSPWLWLGFGILDFISGVLLLIAKYVPEEEFGRIERLAHLYSLYHGHLSEINVQMQSYHPYYVWAIIGLLSIIIGLAQLLFRLSAWLYTCFTKSKQNR